MFGKEKDLSWISVSDYIILIGDLWQIKPIG